MFVDPSLSIPLLACCAYVSSHGLVLVHTSDDSAWYSGLTTPGCLLVGEASRKCSSSGLWERPNTMSCERVESRNVRMSVSHSQTP